MEDNTTCPTCGREIPILETNCPHDNTQLPGTPNVRIARTQRQTDALQTRYDAALQFASNSNLEASREAFEAEVQSNSHAVLSLSYAELRYLVENERRVFATFYKRVEEGLQIPTGGKWDVLRGIAEHALYQHQKAHVRFAALSLDHVGVKNYGECHVTLKEDMISERTSTFEDNNVVFLVETQASSMRDAVDLPAGHISDWQNRYQLAVAKHTKTLPQNPPNQAESASILIDQGKTTADDRCIELHIWGPMTVITIEKVVIIPQKVKRKKRPKKAEIASLREILDDYGVEVIEQ